MSKSVPAIRSVKARSVVVPLARPVKNAFGVIDVGPLVLIDVETDQGVTGHAYIFAYTRLTVKPLVHLIVEIGRELTGKPVAPYDLMRAMDAKFRLLGWQGLVGMAVSGLDMAYWDALGQIADRPLAELLGASPRPIQAGENWWFPRGFSEAIAAGASDFIMPDLMKCGGVTGWLQVAAQAEAANIPMSSHLFAEASAHMLAVTPTAHWLEFLDFARVILAEPAEIVDGTVTAQGPGLGLEWNEAAVAKYLV